MKAKKLLMLFAVSVNLITAGCANPVGPESSLPGQSEWFAVDFENFRVESEAYPKFYAKQPILPPAHAIAIPVAGIKETDLWIVRYRFNEFYLIFSESYNERQCRLLIDSGKNVGIAHKSPLTGKCSSYYFYCIVVDMKGNVTNGWKLVHNSDVVSSSRSQNFQPFSRPIGEWGNAPQFRFLN